MKKFITFNILIAFIWLGTFTATSQQLPQFTQYMYNTISINPAYAGSRETLSIVGLHRSQWAGFGGGPTTQTISIHSPLENKKIGLGMTVINDHLGYQNFLYLNTAFSYTINVNAKTKLAFGIKAGFVSYSLDAALRQAEFNDPSVYGIKDRLSPNIGTGAFLHTNRWYVGLSAPGILNTNYNKKEGYQALERAHYYFTSGYVFDMSSAIKFKPAIMIKATKGAPLSYDATANFLFNEKLWLGAAYRINESAGAFGAIVDFQVTKQLRIGYTYEIPTSDIKPYSNGTHEILLMFEVFKNKIDRVKSPRYF